MKISNDQRHLAIDLKANLTAAEVETLIADLAVLRAKMVPEVPLTLRVPTFNDPIHKVLEEHEPAVEARVLTDGRTRFWLRNRGLGWLVFNFNGDQSLELRDFFASALADGGDDGSMDPGNGGTSH